MNRFQDKVVWITGASSGLGEALAYAFRSEGARLILSARNGTELERVRKQCGGGEQEVVALPLDLADTAGLKARAEQALAVFGRIDVLVNNGGVGTRGQALEIPVDLDERVLRVNYLGTVALTKAVLPSMIERKQGQIVVISSLMGKISVPGGSAYAASKHALHGFFEALRAEVWREGIHITLVMPGYVRTNISINALKPDGTTFGKMDRAHANALSADKAARQIVDAVAKRKAESYIGREVFGVYIYRLFPGLFRAAVKRIRF
ncbi:MAG: SDR family oxidoreductase [Anaerolineae bacterium]